jgi:hypothetical protein
MSTRDVSQEVLSLFDAPPSQPLDQISTQERRADRPTKDFVRWCCSFGDGFRNSPDVTNLRYWAHKNKLKLKPAEESEILQAARPLFLKRIEQLVRKSEAQS